MKVPKYFWDPVLTTHYHIKSMPLTVFGSQMPQSVPYAKKENHSFSMPLGLLDVYILLMIIVPTEPN